MLRKFAVKVYTEEEKIKALEKFEELGYRWRTGKNPTDFTTFDTPTYINSTNRTLSYGYNPLYEHRQFIVEEFFCMCNSDCFYCDSCNEEFTDEEELYYFNGNYYCSDCLEELTFICDNCGDREYDEEMIETRNERICRSCYESYYSRCNECGVIVRSDDIIYDDYEDCYYCNDCYNSQKSINSYHYKPAPIFYGNDDKLYLGIELEIDKGGESNEKAQQLLDVMNINEERIYCKHDGSIERGFEIVSHPATLQEHYNNFNWSGLMEKALDLDYRSHNTSTCGLHIHVNRNAFGCTYEEQEEIIAKIVYFVELHWNELFTFSRRSEYNIERWANRYGIESDTQKTYKKAKGNYERYVAVNLQNNNTIEFRFFRGTLKHSTFIATLQLVETICKVAQSMSEKDMERLSWSDFVKHITYPELIEYLKIKQLYINDFVEINESEEE